jgi:uncharacterized protein (DUF927 family)
MHETSRFAPRDEPDRHIVNRAGYLVRECENGRDVVTEYWVLPEVFKAELCKGFDARMVTRVLAERGLLIVGGEGKPQAKVKIGGLQRRVYRIQAVILEL